MVKKDKKKSKKSTGWKPTVKTVLKTPPHPTYVVSSDPRSTSFQKAWNRESLLGWK